ncbi:uncharacterized protein LOC129218058 [Uloborus diversus]|uniref:uncharacterized protein LOC129218058 n=1 Tax=Uloborus diversus TaxID=327109 RepID=UPI002409E1E8|nr:uncharacterized protein LOC129218058 [Uloborus diversus]
MDSNSSRAKHQKEALLVAQDVFHYLSSNVFPENAIKRPKEKSNYHQNIGKACSYRLKFARKSFREICVKEFPNRILGSRDFVSWFQGVLSRHSQECSSPFSATIESLSLMFEAVCYAFEKGQIKLYQILPIMWTNHFMQKVYPEFFNKGGWHSFIKKASETVESYETFFLTSEAGALELIAGFKEDPTPTPTPSKAGETTSSGKMDDKASSGKTDDKAKQITVPLMLQRAGFPEKVDESSNLAKTLRGLLDLSVGQNIINTWMQECVMAATPKERLPGNRKVDPLCTYDTSPEISPRESPSPIRKNPGKDEKSCYDQNVGDLPQKVSGQNSHGKKKTKKRGQRKM